MASSSAVSIGEDADTYTENNPVAPPTNLSPQYSPSISHDEVEGDGFRGSGTSIEVAVQGSRDMGGGSESDDKVGGEWEGFDEEESWSDFEEPEEQEKQVSKMQVVDDTARVHRVDRSLSGQSSSKLVLKPSKRSEGQGTEGRSEKEDGESKVSLVKGRLSAEDLQRLEAQSMMAQNELDLFADMTPKISSSGGSGGSLHSPLARSGGHTDKANSTPSSTSTAFQYHTKQEEVR